MLIKTPDGLEISMAPVGRPTIRTTELEDAICAHIASGKSLRSFCRQDGAPDLTTVLRWVLNEEDFAIKYRKARKAQAEALVDEMVDIADDGSNDWMEVTDKEGNVIGQKLNNEHVARSKLRLEQRRWLAQKFWPKVYGDKVAVVGGDDDDKPIRVSHELDVSNLSLEQLEALEAALKTALGR